MTRFKMLLSTIILGTIPCFSWNISQDSTITITKEQLKTINIIINDHSKLKSENSLLTDQVKLYKEQIVLYNKQDSVNVSKIKSLNKEVKKQKAEKSAWKIGGISVSLGLLILMLL